MKYQALLCYILAFKFHRPFGVVIHFICYKVKFCCEQKSCDLCTIDGLLTKRQWHHITPLKQHQKGANRHSPKNITIYDIQTIRVRILSDAFRCNRFMFANTNRCKQTSDFFFFLFLYLKQSSLHLPMLRQLNTKLYSIIVVGVWIYFFLPLPWYWFLFFFFFVLFVNFRWTRYRFIVSFDFSSFRFLVCETTKKYIERKYSSERLTMQIYVVCSTTFKLNLQWHKWTIAMIIWTEKKNEERMSCKPPHFQTGFSVRVHQLIPRLYYRSVGWSVVIAIAIIFCFIYIRRKFISSIL